MVVVYLPASMAYVFGRALLMRKWAAATATALFLGLGGEFTSGIFSTPYTASRLSVPLSQHSDCIELNWVRPVVSLSYDLLLLVDRFLLTDGFLHLFHC